MKRGPKPVSPYVRFWRYVSPCPNTGCWWWAGAASSCGRAMMYAGKATLAYRVSYEVHAGCPIPNGLLICHRCDNGLCVNPDHLFLGTVADNSADMVSKGRHNPNPNRGVAHHNAKLTEDAIRAIRASSLSQRATARQFGVSKVTVARIKSKESWPHVE